MQDKSNKSIHLTNGQVGVKKRAQVVVIGAGLAGLSAAQRLYESGIHDIIILEGQDRVGGRIHTVNRGDYLLELGAQWLHGANENPLYKWLTEMDMLNDFEDASWGFKGMFCTQGGQEVDKNLVLKVLKIVCDSKLDLSKNNIARDQVDDDQANNNDGRPRNAGQIFRRKLEAKMKSDEQLASNKSLARSVLEWFLRYEQIENGCDSMNDVSIASYTDWTDWGEGTLMNFKNGYKSLLDWFCKQFPSQQLIHLNKQVLNTEILRPALANDNKQQQQQQQPSKNVWIDSEGKCRNAPVLIRYCDIDSTNVSPSNLANGENKTSHNNHKHEEQFIECDHVIVTVSLGFLKRNSDSFFRPALPRVKQQLINSIGFGTVNKIILQFERPFWRDSGFKLVWPEDKSTTNRQDEEFPAWVRDIISFDCVRRQPNHLIGWIGGWGARQMELESDEQVARICLRLMDSFLPGDCPRPTRLISCTCTRWNSNPFACGSYSFQSMGSLDLQVEKLQEPLYESSGKDTSNEQQLAVDATTTCRMPRVLFAGEATAGKLYATTHGAIISGWREADRLGDLLLGAPNEAAAAAANQSGRRSLTSNLVPLDELISANKTN